MYKKFERSIVSEMLEIFERVVNERHFESFESIKEFYYDSYFNAIPDCPDNYDYDFVLDEPDHEYKYVENGYVIEIKLDNNGHKYRIDLVLYIVINNDHNTIDYSVCEENLDRHGDMLYIEDIIERRDIPINNINKLEFRNIFMEMLDEISDKFFYKTRAKSARK